MTNWTHIAAPADGSVLIAATGNDTPGYVFVSTNYGVAWSANSSLVGWADLASSADGANLYGARGIYGVYRSTDTGTTWTISSALDSYCIACSADGSIIASGGDQAPTYISRDFGATWAPVLTNAGIAFSNVVFTTAACSADGQTIIFGTEDDPNGGTYAGSIYMTTNSAADWFSPAAGTHAQNSFWLSIACSADAKTIIGSSPYGGGLWISTNGGFAWWTTNLWAFAVTASSGGTRLAAADWSGHILTSADSGVNWSSVTPAGGGSQRWFAMASSADGNRLAAALYNGAIWVSYTNRSPILNVQNELDKLLLSWIVPSSPFVLQQSSGLLSPDWSDVPIVPTLNYTNVTHEIRLPRSSSGAFFRLRSQ